MERTTRVCGGPRHFESRCSDAEDKGWQHHPMELGEQVQRRIFEVWSCIRYISKPGSPVRYRVDIPVQALNLYFNGMGCPLYRIPQKLIDCSPVTHPVVSQVNPHVHLFFFAPQGSAGKPVAHSKGKGMRSALDYTALAELAQDGGAISSYPPRSNGSSLN